VTFGGGRFFALGLIQTLFLLVKYPLLTHVKPGVKLHTKVYRVSRFLFPKYVFNATQRADSYSQLESRFQVPVPKIRVQCYSARRFIFTVRIAFPGSCS